jgi:toluene monooxygenase system ferredoxin subunit
MLNGWSKVGTEEEFSNGTKLVSVAGRQLVIARLNGTLFAFSAVCPHAGGPMERAEIEGTVVSCPLHAWRFDLSKRGEELHGYRPLAVNDLKIDRGVVYVRVDGA